MGWILDTAHASGATVLRRQIAAYLNRHGEPDSDHSGAELVVAELLSNAVRHTTGPCWVSVDWSLAEPILRASDLGDGFVVGAMEAPDIQAIGGRGLFIVSSLVLQLDVRRRASGVGVGGGRVADPACRIGEHRSAAPANDVAAVVDGGEQGGRVRQGRPCTPSRRSWRR